MRLDQFLTQHVFTSLKRLTTNASTLEIPILMYHSISDDTDGNVHPYYRTVTTPATFAMHINCLNEWGYEVITLSEAVNYLRGDRESSKTNSKPKKHVESACRRVVITFDDGFRDFFSIAFPILDRFSFKATVFISSGFIDKTFITERECLRSEEIKELSKKGIEFGSHSVSHPQLKNLTSAEVVNEVSASKAMIEQITGATVDLFSYPYGFPEDDTKFTRELSKILSEQGYTAGVTTVIGLSKKADLPFFLKRLPINDCDDSQFLRAKLEGGYDWLRYGQWVYKRLKGAF